MENLSQQPESADTVLQENTSTVLQDDTSTVLQDETSIVEAPQRTELVQSTVDSKSDNSTSDNSKSDSKWQFVGKNIVDFLGEIPSNLAQTYKRFQTPIVSVVLLLTIAILVKILLAVFSALNEIPLVQPALELIGGGYVVWFTFRYLLKGSTREELGEQVSRFIDQFMNKKTKSS